MIAISYGAQCPAGTYNYGTWYENGVPTATDCEPTGDSGSSGGGGGGGSNTTWNYGLCSPVTHQGAYCATPRPSYTGTVNQKILQAAKSYVNFSTKNIAGTDHGKVACAYMVNRILQDSVGHGFGSGFDVPSMANALEYAASATNPSVISEGTLASGAQPQAGDIVIMDGTDWANEYSDGSDAFGHVGICADNGCDQIYSNSTGYTEFMNNFHDPNMDLGPSAPATFYRVLW